MPSDIHQFSVLTFNLFKYTILMIQDKTSLFMKHPEVSNMSNTEIKPNILVIMTDQHSKFFLGTYGNKLVRTPNLDRLAKQGMKFTNTYCAAPLCVPSRMSFLTSQSPTNNEVWNNNHILNSGIPTWATLLSTAGYETSLLGRMHFSDIDQHHGFEYRPVSERGAGPVGFTHKGGPFWTKFPGKTSGQSRAGVEIAGTGHTHYQWSDEERTRVTVEWLKEKAKNPSHPFAAVLGYVLPHCPYVALKDLFDYYYDKIEIPSAECEQPDTIKRFRKIRGLIDPELPKERIRVALAAYYALCEHIDSLIGNVLDTLESTGLAENTLVIYTSDHGEMAGEHGCWWKSNYYEGSAGVPMIARWPGVINPDTISNNVCNLMDIGPTLAEIAGTSFPYGIDGRSMLEIMKNGNDQNWENETFCEFADFNGGQFPSKMIRSGPWKLWFYADNEKLAPALFNLDEDPNELNDLGTDPQYENIRKILFEKIYEGWNPESVLVKSRRNWDYFDLLREWGLATDPEAPDAMIYPSDAYESDVELL